MEGSEKKYRSRINVCPSLRPAGDPLKPLGDSQGTPACESTQGLMLAHKPTLCKGRFDKKNKLDGFVPVHYEKLS